MTISEDNNGWQRISGPHLDVTGDDFGDNCDRYSLQLVKKFARNPEDRKTLIYMNRDRTVKMVAEPSWDTANGSTYSLTVSKKIG